MRDTVRMGNEQERKEFKMNDSIKAVVLAAGKGTRLQSEQTHLPKVMRQANGQPLLAYVLDSLSFLPKENIILVVGYQRETILSAYPEYPYAVQAEQLGTGHAVQCAADALSGFSGHVLVCCGDTPLLKRKTLEALVHTHLEERNACTILTALLEDGGNYGRILRTADGGFSAIVESKDCTPEQRAVRLVNVGTYLFRCPDLLAVLSKLQRNNAQGEYYLTDAPALLQAAGGQVGLAYGCTVQEMLGVNTPEQLAQVEAILSAR